MGNGNAKRSQKGGEQTGRAIHPVDGSLDRLCDPVRQSTRGIHPAQKGSGSQKANLNRLRPSQPACRHSQSASLPPRQSLWAQKFKNRETCTVNCVWVKRNGNKKLFGCTVRGSAPPGGPQRRSGEPSPGWSALSVCSPFRGNASRSSFTGASPRAPAAF